MNIYTLECMIITSAGLEETFAFFENPRNLAKITPPWMGFEIVTPDLEMNKGLVIDYRFRWLGLPMTWRTLISDYNPPHLFVDEALKSPYKLWRHRHTFEATENGTIVRDRVDYALPFGPLGAIANKLMVRKQLEEIFAYRQQKIRELIGVYANT